MTAPAGTMPLLDKDGNEVDVPIPPANGRALAASSRPVALSNEDKAALDLLHTDSTTLHTDLGTLHGDLGTLNAAVGGLATAAKQPGLGTAGTPNANVLTVQGIAGGTALKIDGSAVTQPVSLLTVPLPAGAATDASITNIQATPGSDSVKAVGVQGVTNGKAVKVDGSAVTQPVSIGGTVAVSQTSQPLPTGASTSTVEATAGTDAAKAVAVQGVTNGKAVKVDGSAVTQPVSVAGTLTVTQASQPLPTGAATSAKQPALGTAGSPSTDVITVQGSASGTAIPVNVTGGVLSETLWTDDTGAYFVRVDTNGTITWKTMAGTAGSAPAGSNPRPASVSNLSVTGGVADTLWTDNTNAYFVRSYNGTTVTWKTMAGGASSAPGTGAKPVTGSGGGGASGALPAALGATTVANSLPITIATDDQLRTDLHTMATDTSNVVTVGVISTPSSTFTRPSDGPTPTTYAIGDLVANSITAASVTPMQFTAASANGGSGMIRRARIRKSGVSTSNASFRLHLWTVAPTVSTTGDNGVMASVVSGLSSYIGALDITVDRGFVDGACGAGMAHAGADINFVCAAGDRKLYGLLEATGAYAPAAGEVFNVDLELLPN